MKFSIFSLLATLSVHAQLIPSKEHPKVKIPEGLTLTQFADKSKVVNATALCLDANNRVFVSETHRWRVQVQDVRYGGKNAQYIRERLHDDISIMDRYGRTALHKKWSGKEPEFLKWEEFDDNAEVIKLLEDTTGDGKADKLSVFRGDFNDPLGGTSGGLIEKDGTVYFAMIPGVYSLRDLDGDGKAEEVKTLVDGFGLRISFSGHDMNGFAWGPDGKLYWSIGDRGYDVQQNDKRFTRPDSGAIFRSNPDGSDFEVFAFNLRNPKEIVFDEFGNLFTVDNDYDKGDRERIVYLVEHGDSGWKMGHQTIGSFSKVAYNHMGPRSSKQHQQIDIWMNEGMWLPRNDRQPAHIIPPIANTVNGPCGLAYNPGVTTLSDAFAKHFFVVSYVGNSTNSGIFSFTLKPDGAGFSLDKNEWFLRGIGLTDLDWSTDGKLYLSDYGGGWTKSTRGGVYTIAASDRLKDPKVEEVKQLFAEGIPKMDSQKLFKLLAHADQRIRKRSQFALAERGKTSLPLFQDAIQKGQPLLRRIHGIWGIGQLAQKDASVLKSLAGLLKDSEMEVRANVSRTLGNHPKHLAAFQKDLTALLNDSSLRVVSLASIALANQGDKASVDHAIALLERNADKDVIIRHGGIMILARAARPSQLGALKTHASTAVRRAAVVALRRQESKMIEAFFDDADTSIRQEAIRGAYDENIIKTFPALSARAYEICKRVTKETKYHPLTARRAMHAAWTLARPQDLSVITSIVNDSALDFRVRRDAIIVLLDWNNPPVPDPVTGFVRTLPKNRIPLSKDVLTQLQALYDAAPNDRSAARLLPWSLKLVKQEKLPLSHETLKGYVLAGWVRDIARVSSLELLAPLQKGKDSWQGTLEKLFTDKSAKVRSKARELLFKVDAKRATGLLGNILTSEKATLTEKQLTVKTLADLKTPEADQMIKTALTELTKGTIAPGLALDIVTAAEATNSSEIKALLTAYRAKLPKNDPLAEWTRLCVTGGDIKRGKDLFFGHATGQCQRCHTMHGVGGDVGPELGAIGKTHDEAYLLRSLISPHTEVAEGYGLGSITLKDGTVISGTILLPDENGNARVKIDKDIKTIKKSQIKSRSEPMSAMPPMAGILTKQEVRDIVAYLYSCKVDKTDDGHK